MITRSSRHGVTDKDRLAVNVRSSERVLKYLQAEFERPELQHGSRLPGVRQIANHLKVSIPTVQRVFQKFAKEGRIRTEVGSGTFLVARGVQRAGGLSFVLSLQFPPAGLVEAWASRIYGGIMHAASHSDVPIALHPTSGLSGNTRAAKEKVLAQRSRADGLILFPFGPSDEIRAAYESDGKPVVDMNPPSETATANFVSSDYFGASMELAMAWKATGRRRILVMVGGPLKRSVSSRLRLAGLVNGLGEEAGSIVEHRVVAANDTSERDGCEAMLCVLAKHDWVPDAVYCAGDHLALGVLQALEEKGYRVPEQVSVAGGTGLDISASAWPQLTRTSQPFERLGEGLVALLRQRIEQNGDPVPGRVLPSPWIGGGTTRAEENELLGIRPV